MHGLVEYHLRGMALGSPNSEKYAVSVSKMENVLFHGKMVNMEHFLEMCMVYAKRQINLVWLFSFFSISQA